MMSTRPWVHPMRWWGVRNFDIAAIFKALYPTAVAHSPGEGVSSERAISMPLRAVLARLQPSWPSPRWGEITDETFPRITTTRGYLQNSVSIAPSN